MFIVDFVVDVVGFVFDFFGDILNFLFGWIF